MSRARRGIACLWLAVLVGAGPSAAQEASRAFVRGDYAEAAAIWTQEAETGSAEAAVQLGYLHDLGLGVPTDRAKAFDYYLQAAEAGLPEAAFNVGVMLDAGTGVSRDVAAAATWYARAAAGDHVRAQYNLGLLYADGAGVPQNSDLARYWLDRVAVALPAAAERIASLPPADGGWTAPSRAAAMRVERAAGVMADIVWTAAAGPEASRFAVQYLAVDATGRATGAMRTLETRASALSLPISEPRGRHLWRVARIDPINARYIATPWRWLASGTAPDPGSGGQIRFEIASGDARAGRLAETLAGALRASGLGVAIQPVRNGPDRSMVLFSYAEDLSRAAEIADFVPGIGAGNYRQAQALGTQPGEIVVRLAFAPDSPADMDVEGEGPG